MLDTLIGGHGHGFGHKDHISNGYGFEGHNEFVSHEDSERSHFDRQSRYDHQMRLPANHGRPPMARMPPCDEEESDDDEFIKRSRSHHTTVLPHHQQKPHMNFMPPPPLSQPHHNVSYLLWCCNLTSHVMLNIFFPSAFKHFKRKHALWAFDRGDTMKTLVHTTSKKVTCLVGILKYLEVQKLRAL